jgi:CheY-like chemotaxis protein
MPSQDLLSIKDLSWLNGITILIAEDDHTNYSLLVAMLKYSKAKIVWAQNGQEAVNFIKNKPAKEKCIVLMDIKMPIVNGYEANKQIKEFDPLIPVIAVTAYAQLNDREKIMQSNFDAYITKPIDLHKFLNILAGYAK